MPVTKTAKRALRGSKNKETVNKIILSKLGIAIRIAKKSKSLKDIVAAISLGDRAAKKQVIHKNKASRIKAQLSKLISGSEAKSKPAPKKKSSKKS